MLYTLYNLDKFNKVLYTYKNINVTYVDSLFYYT
jgi:hypothetical protein